jgi:quercetin dioxygenase-like cupin family protein
MALRFVVIGVGEDGRSRVVEVRDVVAGMVPRFPSVQWNCVWGTAQQPPELPVPRRSLDELWLDIQLPAGATRWAIFNFHPGLSTSLRHSATLDYNVVLDGEVTLGLEEGEILLCAGDCVIIPAALHSWRTGSKSCTISVVYWGLEPPGKS